MNQTYELYRSSGLMTSLKIKDHAYDIIEMTLAKKLTDDNGKTIVDSKYQMFFTEREFREFLLPFVNDMKARIENANSVQE
jgi:hypothetical protein